MVDNEVKKSGLDLIRQTMLEVETWKHLPEV